MELHFRYLLFEISISPDFPHILSCKLVKAAARTTVELSWQTTAPGPGRVKTHAALAQCKNRLVRTLYTGLAAPRGVKSDPLKPGDFEF